MRGNGAAEGERQQNIVECCKVLKKPKVLKKKAAMLFSPAVANRFRALRKRQCAPAPEGPRMPSMAP